MIGEIRKTFLPFYDTNNHKMSVKCRPALVIAQSDNDDYVVLPVSRITRQANRDMNYDIPVNPQLYPALGLSCFSYVRTHKQTTVHMGEVGDKIGDMKADYEDLYLFILEKREEFSTEITRQAID